MRTSLPKSGCNIWSSVKAKARRRKMFFDGQEILAVFINSISDIDEVVELIGQSRPIMEDYAPLR